LREQPIRDYGAGRGGWPTIRYFNKHTGPKGAAYEKKTDKAMCDELGPKNNYMQLYIEEAGTTFLCQMDGTGCDEEELAYIEQMKAMDVNAHIQEYESMLSSTPDHLGWGNKKMKILKQMIQNAPKQEL